MLNQHNATEWSCSKRLDAIKIIQTCSILQHNSNHNRHILQPSISSKLCKPQSILYFWPQSPNEHSLCDIASTFLWKLPAEVCRTYKQVTWIITKDAMQLKKFQSLNTTKITSLPRTNKTDKKEKLTLQLTPTWAGSSHFLLNSSFACARNAFTKHKIQTILQTKKSTPNQQLVA